MDHQLQDFLKTATAVARKAGEVVKEAFLKEKTTCTKASFADLVTETDKKVESLIIASLQEKYPNHKFIGEESTEKSEWTNDPTWIIDPVDGTSNFVHSVSNNCVCIGLSIDKKIVVGVVYLPITDQMYTAVKDQGAYCNEKKLSVSKITDLKNSLVYCEGGSSREPDFINKKMENMKNILVNSHGIRALGSAAVDMCMVAQGSGDAYVEYGLHIWDMAASSLIVTEAGGVIMDPTGSALDLQSRRILCASSQTVADQLSKLQIHLDMERD